MSSKLPAYAAQINCNRPYSDTDVKILCRRFVETEKLTLREAALRIFGDENEFGNVARILKGERVRSNAVRERLGMLPLIEKPVRSQHGKRKRLVTDLPVDLTTEEIAFIRGMTKEERSRRLLYDHRNEWS